MIHEPVLLNEALDALHIKNSTQYIDATLGAGGHTIGILKRGGNVLGIEADEKMLDIAKERIQETCPVSNRSVGDYILVNGNFRNIASIAKDNGIFRVDGILFDLGISSVHLDSDSRGFSFKDESAPLDMRLNTSAQSVTASDLLNSLPEKALVELFSEGMGKTAAKRLSERVAKARAIKKFVTVSDFLDVAGRKKRGKIHPATKAFMALRIAVNTELATLTTALEDSKKLLVKKGKIVVISFHSGEDRIVKKVFGESELVTPSEDEIQRNPRARSAKMRVFTNE